MKLFRRTYFIYPEIQKPILVQVIIGFVALCLIQALCIYWSMHWLEQITKVNLEILVDARVLGPWKTLLFLSLSVPLIMNLMVSIFVALYVSNKFAGPIYRMEKEITEALLANKKVDIKLRKNDNLKSLAEKINQISKS